MPINTPSLSFSARQREDIMASLGSLRHLFEDPAVNEIMINAPDDVFVRVSGVDRKVDVNVSAAQIKAAVEMLASRGDKEVNENNLILSARLPGLRLECIMPPAALNGPSMCIRRHASSIFSIDEYVEKGVMTQTQADAIRAIVQERKNFLIAGGTFSGKTTLMNSILALIDPGHRLFVIEQVAELKLSAPNQVRIECDPDFGVTPTKAVRAAMRYSPDRVLLGELRGPEANDWLEAANTGHPGSAATLHANGAAQALSRLSSLVLQAATGMPHAVIQDRIGETVDAVIYIEHRYGKRHLKELVLVEGYDREKSTFNLTPINH